MGCYFVFGPSVKLPKFIIFYDPQVASDYMLVIFVYKLRASATSCQNRNISKIGFDIYIANAFIKIKSFGPYCIKKRLENSSIIEFDINR